jgi:hypothetical protein
MNLNVHDIKHRKYMETDMDREEDIDKDMDMDINK